MLLDELSTRVAGELAERGLHGAAADGRVSAAPDARTVRYYTTLGLLDRPMVEALTAEAREHAAARKLEAPFPALRLREIALEPGVRLIVEEGWLPRDAPALEARIH